MWEVITPDKRILDEFTFESSAINFADNCLDFLTEKGKERVKNRNLTEQALRRGYF